MLPSLRSSHQPVTGKVVESSSQFPLLGKRKPIHTAQDSNWLEWSLIFCLPFLLTYPHTLLLLPEVTSKTSYCSNPHHRACLRGEKIETVASESWALRWQPHHYISVTVEWDRASETTWTSEMALPRETQRDNAEEAHLHFCWQISTYKWHSTGCSRLTSSISRLAEWWCAIVHVQRT